MKIATYNLVGNTSGAVAVIINLEGGTRAGYDAQTIIDAPHKEFGIAAGTVELQTLKAEGYTIAKGHDIIR
jgi:hypothetical protein